MKRNPRSSKGVTSKARIGDKDFNSPSTKAFVPKGKSLRPDTSPTISCAKANSSAISQPRLLDSKLQRPRPKGQSTVSIKPTAKLMNAVQNFKPGRKPLQVKIIEARDEDTSSYESESESGSGSDLSTPTANHKGKKNNATSSKVKIDDLSSLFSKANVDLTELIGHHANRAPELPGVPKWFPEKIKRVLRDEGCPDALPFKSVKRLIKYRALLEACRRKKWQRYLKAGKTRWQLGNSIKKLRERPGCTTEAFYEYRVRQQKMWKEKAIRAMKRLDTVVNGVSCLDKTISEVFKVEREVYVKHFS